MLYWSSSFIETLTERDEHAISLNMDQIQVGFFFFNHLNKIYFKSNYFMISLETELYGIDYHDNMQIK